VEIPFPPLEEGFDEWISITEFIQLAVIMRMSKVVSAVRLQVSVRPICLDISNPSAAESRIAIATGELASSIKRNLQGLGDRTGLVSAVECIMYLLILIYHCLVNAVTDRVGIHVFNLPAVLAPRRTLALLHHQSIHLLLCGIMQCRWISQYRCWVDVMCWRMMAAGGLSRSQPYGSVVPLGCTEGGTEWIYHPVLVF
jgi:hypothetical protein